jgi:hypothetical protein
MSEFDEYAEARRAELLADAISRRSSGSPGTGDTSGMTAAQKKLAYDQELASKQFINSLQGMAGSLNNGTQGLSAYNGVVGAGSNVFKAAMAPLEGFGKIAGSVAGSLGTYVQLVNKQTDALAKSYQDISTVGATGKQGLQGVYNTMQQFGLGIADLPKFNALIKENAESLSNFGGTVQQGLKSFANLSEGIQRTGLQTELLNMGLNTDAINKGLGGFLKTTTMLGNSQKLLNMTTEQQSKAASDYIKQQDIVTKLTGLSAEQQQKSLEASLANDRFAADRYLKEQKLADFQTSGQTEAAAKLQEQLAKEDIIRNKYTGAMQQGYLDFVAGAGAQTEAGRAFMNAVGQKGIEALRDPMKDAGAALNEANAGVAAQLKQFGPTIVQAGKMEFLPAVKDMMVAAGSKINEMSVTAAVGQQKGQIENPELALANYTAMIQKQQDITKEFQNLIQLGMKPVGVAMLNATEFIEATARKIPGAGGIPRTGSQAYITPKEKTERGETELLTERNRQSPFLAPEQLESIRTGTKEDIEAVKKWATDTASSILDIGGISETVKKAAKSAGDSVNEAVDSLKSQFDRIRNRLNEVAPLMTPSRRTGALPVDQVAALQPVAGGSDFRTSMSAMISEMRNNSGPNNNYNPSLVNATYTPNRNVEDTDAVRSTVAGTEEQNSRDQIMAFNNMSAKLDDMIGLLSRSVGIQDKTLRAAYSA